MAGDINSQSLLILLSNQGFKKTQANILLTVRCFTIWTIYEPIGKKVKYIEIVFFVVIVYFEHSYCSLLVYTVESLIK